MVSDVAVSSLPGTRYSNIFFNETIKLSLKADVKESDYKVYIKTRKRILYHPPDKTA